MAEPEKLPNPDKNPTNDEAPVKEPGKSPQENPALGGDIQKDEKGGIVIAPTPKPSAA